MNSLELIKLETCWQGSNSFNSMFPISAIDFKVKNFAGNIYATLNTNLSDQNQELSFIVGLNNKRLPAIKCLGLRPDEIQSLVITVRVLQTMNFDYVIKKQDNTYEFVKTHREINIPVEIAKFPDFKLGDHYQIKIINEDSRLTAIFENKKPAPAPATENFVYPSLPVYNPVPYNNPSPVSYNNPPLVSYTDFNEIESSASDCLNFEFDLF